MFVQHFFELDKETVEELRGMAPEFGYNGFGEFLFYRTYSRRICDKCRKLLKYNKEEDKDYCRNCNYDFTIGQENWADVVIRNINGTFSIRKDWYIKNHILWEEDVWQHYARHMAISMFKMEWSPPGRGLWAMGTDFIYERGSMALNNCGYTEITDEIGKDVNWVMDALMMGVGVGFDPLPSDNFKTYVPVGEYDYKISDDREGWCDATQARIDCYLSPGLSKPRFIYDGIRKANLPIRGFGGVSSGPEPLIYLHKQIDKFFEMYRTLDWYTVIHLKADIVNAVGCCVIAGNVRRSAELLKGKYKDIAELKNYERYPYREEWAGMSNNSISLETDEDFDYLIDIAESIKANGEPGFVNIRNFPFGRIGKKMKGLRLDKATGINPCIPGESWILTSNGHRQVKDLLGNKFTAIVNGYEYNSTDLGFFNSGYKEVFEVKTKEGYSFKCTENHEVLVNNDGLKLYIPLDRLRIGDEICLHNHGNYSWDSEGTWEEGYVLGWLFGDGSINKKTKKSILYFYDDDVAHLPFLAKLIGKNIAVNYSKNTEVYRAWISGKDLDNLCQKFGLTSKNIDERLLKTSSSFYEGFVSGLFDTDGTVNIQDGAISLWQNDKELLEKVQLMLIALGIKSNIYLGKKAEQKIIKNQSVFCNTSYRLVIGNLEQLDKFSKRVNFQLPRKQGLLNFKVNQRKRISSKDKYISRIESITPIGKQEVYDCQIPSINCVSVNGQNLHNCGEQLLENKELCTLAITYPTKCKFDDANDWLKACEYATMYACTVTLLPTHRPETNAVMLRNRRIGVDITDVSLWKHEIGITNLVKNLRKGYKRVRATGKWANSEAGVPEPIRFTTIKPGGTGPKLPGVRSGWQNPTFGYTLRRVRCPQNQNIFDILHRANVPHEPDVFSKNTEVFEFAIDQSAEGRVKPATEVSIWEQAMMLVLLQREWSDNAVSNTIYFQPKWNLVKDFNLKDSIYYDELEQPVLDYLLNETSVSYADIFERREHESKEHKVKLEQDNYTDDWHLKIWKFDPNHEEDAIEGVLAAIAPLTKSVSVLPHSTVGAYRQMPEEGLTKEEYEERLSRIRKIDWTKYRGSDGIDEKFCEGPSCTILPG